MHSFSRSLDTDKDLAYLIGSPQSIKNLCSHHLQRLSVHAGVSPRRKKEALGKIWGRLIIDKWLWIITCEHGEIKRIEKIIEIREIVSTYYRVILTRLLQLLFTATRLSRVYSGSSGSSSLNSLTCVLYNTNITSRTTQIWTTYAAVICASCID